MNLSILHDVFVTDSTEVMFLKKRHILIMRGGRKENLFSIVQSLSFKTNKLVNWTYERVEKLLEKLDVFKKCNKIHFFQLYIKR